MAYLEGGSIQGAERSLNNGLNEQGANDASAPTDDRPFTIPGWQLVFAGRSRRWNEGGVCALVADGSDDQADPVTLGRSWLVTVGQLGDIWRQENAGVGAAPESVIDAVKRRAGLDLDRGAYRRLAPLGELDGTPVFTITGTEEVLGRLNHPDPAYQSVVAAGLVETWGLPPSEVADYLAGCPGFAAIGDDG